MIELLGHKFDFYESATRYMKCINCSLIIHSYDEDNYEKEFFISNKNLNFSSEYKTNEYVTKLNISCNEVIIKKLLE